MLFIKITKAFSGSLSHSVSGATMMMEESVTTFETHLTAVMDSLIRASVCEITKLFQETVKDYLVEMSLNRKENEALKLRLRLTESKLRTERMYGVGWASHRRNAGLATAAAGEEQGGARRRHKRKVGVTRKYVSDGLFLPSRASASPSHSGANLKGCCCC